MSLVGATVLFCIQERTAENPPVHRPLLITHDGGTFVSGELFLCWDRDRTTPWCRQHMFYAPSSTLRSVEIPFAEFGTGLGQCTTRPYVEELTQFPAPTQAELPLEEEKGDPR